MTGDLILCAVDFSDGSRAALASAAALACRLHQHLCVVTVADSLIAQAADIAHLSSRLTRETRSRLETFAHSVVPPCAWAPSIRVRAEVGAVVPRLIEVAHEERASCIAVGSRGAVGPARSWLGSTTTRVLRASRVPVLVVPPDAIDARQIPGQGPPIGLDRVVCGVDFSEASDAACRQAAELAATLSLPLLLVHAVIAPDAPSMLADLATTLVTDRLAETRRSLQAQAAALHVPAIDVVAETGEPAAVLIRHASMTNRALVVLGLGTDDPSVRPGTIATRVLAAARTPVLAVPASSR